MSKRLFGKIRVSRVFAFALSIALLMSSMDLRPFESIAKGEKDEKTIVAFNGMGYESIQRLYVGASEDEIAFPDRLGATVEYEVEVETRDAEGTGDNDIPKETTVTDETDTSVTDSDADVKDEIDPKSETSTDEESSAATEEMTESEEETTSDAGADDEAVSDALEADPAVTPAEDDTTIGEDNGENSEDDTIVEASAWTDILNAFNPMSFVYAAENTETETVTEDIVLEDISWKIDASRSSGAVFDSSVAGAKFVYVAQIDDDYDIEASLPILTVIIAEKEAVTEEEEQEFDETAYCNGVSISVRADKGVFPAGSTLSVSAISADEDAMEDVIPDDQEIASAYAFDITIHDKDGNEIEPDTSKGSVRVYFTTSEVSDSSLDAEVYHEDDGGMECLGASKEGGDTISAQTDGFSVYWVIFTQSGGGATHYKHQFDGTPGNIIGLGAVLEGIGLSSGYQVDDITGLAEGWGKVGDPGNTANNWAINNVTPFTGTVTIGVDFTTEEDISIDIVCNGEPAAVADITATVTTDSITITAPVDDGGTDYEYSADGSSYADTTAFESLSAGKAYTLYARIKATDTVPAGVAYSETFTTLPSVSISGTEEVGNTLTATVTKDDGSSVDSYTWYRGSDPITGADASTYTLTADDAGSVIKVVVSINSGAASNEATTGTIAGHTHSFAYNVSGSVLTATCSNQTGCSLAGSDYAATLTITPEAASITYDGSTHGASTDLAAFNSATGLAATEVISYSGTTLAGDTYSSATAPTDAGSYTATATISVGGGSQVISAAYAITKGTQATPDAPTLASKTDTTVTLSDDGSGAYEYKMGDGAWQTSPAFTSLTQFTPYNFYRRLKETDNQDASESSAALEVTTSKTQYVITYVNGGGTGDIIEETADYGDSIVLKPANTFTRTGYTFNKWQISGEQYEAGASFAVTGPATATALWTDDIAPTGTITIGTTGYNTLAATLSFSTCSKSSDASVTIAGSDDGSGLASGGVEYYITDSETALDASGLESVGWSAYSGAITLSEGKNTVYAKITDAAGNITYISSTGLTIDDTEPTITGVTDGTTYNDAVTINAADTYLASVTVDGAAQSVSEGSCEATVTAVGSHTVVATDSAGNSTTVGFTIAQSTVTIGHTNTAVSFTEGQELRRDVTTLGMFTIPDDAGTATYSVSGTGISLDSDGVTLIITAAGDYTITVNTAGSTYVAPATAQATLTATTQPLALTGATITSAATPIVWGTQLTASPVPIDLNGHASLSYAWYRGNSLIASATAATYTTTEADVGQTIKVVITQTVEGSSSISKESNATAAIAKQAATPISNVDEASIVYNYASETIASVDPAYEVSSANGATASSISSLTTILNGTGKYYVRKKATTAYEASEWYEVNISRPAAPTGFTVTGATGISAANGSIEGTDATMEYKASSASTYTTASATSTAVAPGTYLIRNKATASAFASLTTEVTVGVAQPSAPTLASKTDTTITVNKVSGQEYTIDDGSTWQTGATFTGLTPNTAYTIKTRVAASDTIAASAVSDGLDVNTNGSIETEVDNNGTPIGNAELDAEIAMSLLTDAEKTRVENGESLKVYLDIDDITDSVPAEDKALIEAAAKQKSAGYKIGMYLNIRLFKQIGTDPAEQITDANTPITMTVVIPVALRGSDNVIRTYYIFRSHAGAAALLAESTSYNIPFETDGFSTYALAYSDKDKPKDPSADPKTDPSTDPKENGSSSGTTDKKGTSTDTSDSSGSWESDSSSDSDSSNSSSSSSASASTKAADTAPALGAIVPIGAGQNGTLYMINGMPGTYMVVDGQLVSVRAPKTGDDMHYAIILIMILICGLIMTGCGCYRYRRSRRTGE